MTFLQASFNAFKRNLYKNIELYEHKSKDDYLKDLKSSLEGVIKYATQILDNTEKYPINSDADNLVDYASYLLQDAFKYAYIVKNALPLQPESFIKSLKKELGVKKNNSKI